MKRTLWIASGGIGCAFLLMIFQNMTPYSVGSQSGLSQLSKKNSAAVSQLVKAKIQDDDSSKNVNHIHQ